MTTPAKSTSSFPANVRPTRTVAMMLAAAAAVSFTMTAAAQDVKPSVDVKAPQLPAGQPVATADAPLRFDEVAHDWGRVLDSIPLEHDFKFTNITDQTITIQNVTATCGCTVPQLTKKVYAPGEAGEIKVQFNPSNRRGAQSKQVTVTFADTQYPQMRLDLSSYVLPMLWVEPNRVLFQDVYKGTGASQQVVVTSRTPNFEITSMEGIEQNFTSRVVSTEDGLDEGDPVRRTTLEVTLAPEAPIGTYNTQLVFKSNEPKWPEFKIFATAMVVGELKADPASALIRTQQVNTPFEAMAIVETRNGVPFEIDDFEWTVEGNHDLALVVDWEDYTSIRGRPTYLIKLSGVTPPMSAQIRATVNVKAKISGKEDEQIPIVLWGTVRGAEAARMMPPAGDFPAVKPGSVPAGVTPMSISPTKPGSN